MPANRTSRNGRGRAPPRPAPPIPRERDRGSGASGTNATSQSTTQPPQQTATTPGMSYWPIRYVILVHQISHIGPSGMSYWPLRYPILAHQVCHISPSGISYLRNRSALAVNCQVIIHCLEVSYKEDQIRSL